MINSKPIFALFMLVSISTDTLNAYKVISISCSNDYDAGKQDLINEYK